jgi:hypothetical protein
LAELDTTQRAAMLDRIRGAHSEPGLRSGEASLTAFLRGD